jgi:type I restriction enzyme S subunit
VKSQFRVEGGDFLISRRQIVHGACAVVSDDFSGAVVSNEYAVLRCREGIDLGYLKHLSHSVYFQQTCFHSCVGIHIEKMIFKVEEWLDREFDLPPVEKQRQIAGVVNAADRKIGLLRDKRDALERFKVGTMDRVVQRDIRFLRNDGSEFPDWKERRLGDVIYAFSGGTPASRAENFFGGNIPFIKSAEIGRASTAQCITTKGLSASSAKMVERGDLLFALYGANSGDVAISSMRDAINQAVLCIRTSESKDYIYHLLRHHRNKICAEFLQGGQGNLSAEIVKSLRFELPSKDEQIIIAAFLSCIEAKIDKIADQIAQFEMFRLGLIQELFP